MKDIYLTPEAVHSGNLILVNARHAYREPVDGPRLAPVPNGGNVLLSRPAMVLLANLMDALQGWSRITPVSGWRSAREQQSLWDGSMADNGAAFTRKYVAVPGHSEHQTGLAIDLGLTQPHIDFIRPEFPYEGICQTFRERCALFGFVERYPRDKEKITGIAHEPWHFRYVGVPHADIMRQKNLTLEEYVDFLRDYPFDGPGYFYRRGGTNIRVSYVPARCGGISLDSRAPHSISGNNVDGFIITEWRNRYAG